MALVASRPYKCFACGESFAKWWVCWKHLGDSGPCRQECGDRFRDINWLQNHCRRMARDLDSGNGDLELEMEMARDLMSECPSHVFQTVLWHLSMLDMIPLARTSKRCHQVAIDRWLQCFRRRRYVRQLRAARPGACAEPHSTRPEVLSIHVLNAPSTPPQTQTTWHGAA